MSLRHLVVIPTYNEKETVEKTVRTVMALEKPFEILIVDDNSPDGTSKIVETLQKEYPALHLIVRTGKNGLKAAYLAGFQWAFDRDYDTIFEMDCDLSHDPKELPSMSQLLSQNDCVVGSRYINGVRVSNWSMFRVLLSRGASLYTRLITWMPINDPTAGYVGYSKSAIDFILKNQHLIAMQGYGFQITLKYMLWKNGYTLTEHPITFREREMGESKMSGNIIWEAIFGVLKLRLSRRFSLRNTRALS
jgi:dolichol-phosphate mannosyltransferase